MGSSTKKTKSLQFLFCAGATPSVADVFRLYSSLVAGLTVADLCIHNDLLAMGIDER